jgi:hypothetical protein
VPFINGGNAVKCYAKDDSVYRKLTNNKAAQRLYSSIMKSRFDIIAVFVLIGVFVFLYLSNYREGNKLDSKGVYILGKLSYSTSEGEMSWMYYYKYRFNGKEYVRNFTGPIKKEILEDSLMYFRILPEDPSVCRQLSDKRVPKCLQLIDVPMQGWSVLPKDTFCDSLPLQ